MIALSACSENAKKKEIERWAIAARNKWLDEKEKKSFLVDCNDNGKNCWYATFVDRAQCGLYNNSRENKRVVVTLANYYFYYIYARVCAAAVECYDSGCGMYTPHTRKAIRRSFVRVQPVSISSFLKRERIASRRAIFASD